MTEQHPRLALLAFTPADAPERHLVVRPYSAQPDPDALTLADMEEAEALTHEDPKQAKALRDSAERLRADAREDALQRSTRFTLGPDPDTETDLHRAHDHRAVHPPHGERLHVEHVPPALAQLMADTGMGALQVWVPLATSGPPCPDLPPPGWYSMLLPLVHVSAWSPTQWRGLPQYNVEATVHRGRTQHPPYTQLEPNALGLACMRMAYQVQALPPVTGEEDTPS